MKVLVTGGAGYLGTELVHALGGDREVSEITIYDNLSRRNPNLFITAPLGAPELRLVDAQIQAQARTLRSTKRSFWSPTISLRGNLAGVERDGDGWVIEGNASYFAPQLSGDLGAGKAQLRQ